MIAEVGTLQMAELHTKAHAAALSQYSDLQTAAHVSLIDCE